MIAASHKKLVIARIKRRLKADFAAIAALRQQGRPSKKLQGQPQCYAQMPHFGCVRRRAQWLVWPDRFHWAHGAMGQGRSKPPARRQTACQLAGG